MLSVRDRSMTRRCAKISTMPSAGGMLESRAVKKLESSLGKSLETATVCKSCRSRKPLLNDFLLFRLFSIYFQRSTSIQPRTSLQTFLNIPDAKLQYPREYVDFTFEVMLREPNALMASLWNYELWYAMLLSCW